MPRIFVRTILTIALFCLPVACSDIPDDEADTGATAGIIVETVQPGTPVPGQALTPRPGVSVDMATARRYEAEGDIEAAAAAYVAIAATQSPDRVEASLAAARLLMESHDFQDARTLLERVLTEESGTPDGVSALYLLGRAYVGLDKTVEALALFDSYIAANGPAAPYAHLDRARALIELERGFEAAQAAKAGLDLGVPASMTRSYLLVAAQAYERAGALDLAIEFYQRLMAESGLFGDSALALQRISTLKELQADPTYVVERDRLLVEYPGSFQAFQLLETAIANGDVIAPTVHGLILYRQNEYTLAEPHFRAQIEAFPNSAASATAYYYLGAILEWKGDIEEALASYEAVDLYYPASHLADDALWWRARILEDDGDLASAGALYARIVNEYPSSPFAADAAFRRGMLAFRAEAYAEAAQAWGSDLAAVTSSLERQRLQLWQGKAMLRAGDSAAATALLRELAAGNDHDYFGIRALGLSQGIHETPSAVQESNVNLSQAWDWAAAEQWLTAHTGAPADSRPWEVDPRWERARELWRVGHGDYGDLEVYALIEAHASSAPALYTLSRELLDAGRIGMSGRAGQRLLRVLSAGPNQGLPRAIMSLSYPAAFGPLVQRYASAEGISPLLLLAFVRQESFFDPRAISPVGALGLTQVLPETANATARDLGVTANVPPEQLLHADLNLRLGARYMANQLKDFNGNVFAALAAYNAGPGAARRWLAAAGNDADLYLETVEYAETRLYLEIVAENYAIYRYIYAGEPEPNLPR